MLGLSAAGAAARDSSPALRLDGIIPLDNVSDRIDHFALDAGRQRLFLAALGNNTVEVIDLAGKKRVRQLTGFAEPQGIAIGPETRRVVVANGQDGICRVFDADSLQETGRVELKDDADNVRYDAASTLFWVGYGSGGLAAIDAQTSQVVMDVKLEAHPESFQLETRGARIFVNVPKARIVAVVDRARHAVIAKWPLRDVSSNFPMALDEARHRLFVGCRKPAKLVVLNTDTGEAVAAVEIVGDSDDLLFDAAHHRIFASGGEGFITVIAQRSADAYEVVEKIPTASGARTSLFDPSTDAVFLAVPHRLAQKSEIRIFHATTP